MFLLVVLVGAVMAGAAMLSLLMGTRIAEKYAPLVDATTGIQLETAEAHAWLEEIISGDISEDIDHVWQHLDQSIWYTRAMLEGGENEEDRFIALDDPMLTQELHQILDKQQLFRRKAEERYAARMEEHAGVGSVLEQQEDMIVESIIRQAREVQKRLKQLTRSELSRFRTMQLSLISAIVVVAIIMAAVLQLFIGSRMLDQLALEKRERQLLRANKELERSNTDLDDFAHTVSHDIKAPLRGIRNYSAILLEDYGDDLGEEVRSKLGRLLSLSERLQHFTDSLLRFSEVSKRSIVLQEVDLNDIIRDVVESLRPDLDRYHVAVCVPHTLPSIRCDPDRMGEVFQNLFSNAIKYNDKQDRWIEIGLSASDFDETDLGEIAGLDDEKPYTFLYVRDNGIGMRQGSRREVFTMLKRLHPRDKFGGGSGVGLSIVRKIVERHNGKVWLDSRPGEGTTVHIALPQMGLG